MKDTHGNCYVVKNELKLEAIENYLEKDSTGLKSIKPTNMSVYLGPNASGSTANWKMVPTREMESYCKEPAKPFQRSLPNNSGTKLSAFECYVKGYLFFNSNSKTSEGVDNTKPHFNAIWLETPTLFSITKTSDGKYQVRIGDFITTDSVAYDGKDVLFKTYCVKVKEDSIINSCLPLGSELYDTNFGAESTESVGVKKLEGVNITIQSLAKYWSN